MSRFYLTLPSHSSMDYYPQNTRGAVYNKLTSPVELNGEWEVGLTEISFSFDIQNVTEGSCPVTFIFPKWVSLVPQKLLSSTDTTEGCRKSTSI